MQTEKPIYNNYNSTSRSFKHNTENHHLKPGSIVKNETELDKLLREVMIRFDTSPKFYQKEDYLKLLKLLQGSLPQIFKENSIPDGILIYGGIADSISDDLTTIQIDDESIYAEDNFGKFYQIGDREYISNGTIWVEFGTPTESITNDEIKQLFK